MAHFEFSQDFNGIAEVFIRRPNYYKPLLEFLEQVMVAESNLSKIDREVLATYVSQLNGCHFCVAAHIATLEGLNAEQTVISALKKQDHSVFSKDTQDLLTFTHMLVTTPDAIRKQDIDILKKSGIAEQTIEDTMNVVSLFSLVNRLVDGIGVKGGEQYFKMVGQALASNGYAKLLA